MLTNFIFPPHETFPPVSVSMRWSVSPCLGEHGIPATVLSEENFTMNKRRIQYRNISTMYDVDSTSQILL